MTTATTSQHRSFPTSLALAAASAAVVAAGLTAYGISESRDSTAPTHSTVNTSTTHNGQCPDIRCMPGSTNSSDRHHGNGQPPLKGGHVTLGMP